MRQGASDSANINKRTTEEGRRRKLEQRIIKRRETWVAGQKNLQQKVLQKTTTIRFAEQNRTMEMR